MITLQALQHQYQAIVLGQGLGQNPNFLNGIIPLNQLMVAQHLHQEQPTTMGTISDQ